MAVLLRGRIVATCTLRDITAAGAGLTKITVRTSGSSLEGNTLPAAAREGWVEGYHVYYSTKTGSTVAAIISKVETAGDSSWICAWNARPWKRDSWNLPHRGGALNERFCRALLLRVLPGLRNRNHLLLNYLLPLGF
ncbi:MAG: hypothetical protein AB1576_00945 [Bacillota bacterium]|jgi:hypothetical protein